MGRKRAGDELLDKPLAVRVPSAVADDWRGHAQAAGLSLADWLRQAVDPGKIRVSNRPTPQTRPKLKRPASTDPALMAGIAKIGNNLNQLARWANSFKSKADSAQVLIALSAIERDISFFLPPNRGATPDRES